jgi:hypothetical protein
MKCEKVQRNLSAYADDEVGQKLREQIAEHLAVCERCAAEFSQLDKVASMAKSSLRDVLSAKQSPSGLRAQVMRSIEPIPAPRMLVLSVRSLVAGAALISLIVGSLVGVVAGSRFHSERDTLRMEIAKQRQDLELAAGTASAAQKKLLAAHARADTLEEELRLLAQKASERDQLASETSTSYARGPVLSSLQMPGARRILENGLF